MKHAAPKTPGVLKLFVVVLLVGAVVSAILTASHLGASPNNHRPIPQVNQ